MIDESDNTKAKTLLETDKWLNLILLMQNEHLLKNYNTHSIINKIELTFQTIRSRGGSVISIDVNQVDQLVNKQHRNSNEISASLGVEYISDLQNLS